MADLPLLGFAEKADVRRGLGHSEDQVNGTKRPRRERVLLQRLAERLKNGEPFTGQTTNYRKDGTPYLASWNTSPICDENGKITHYVSFQLHQPAPRL